MKETIESIREYGVLVPAIARPLEDGGYELISGHRRKHACEILGLSSMPVIIRDIDRNTATIIMVDSNLQRENILPSEKAKAYKMKLEAIKRQGARKRFNFYASCTEVVRRKNCRRHRCKQRSNKTLHPSHRIRSKAFGDGG